MNKQWRNGLMMVAAFTAGTSWWVGCGGDDAYVQPGSNGATDSGAHLDATTGDATTGDGGTLTDAATDAADANSADASDAGDASAVAISIPANAPYDTWTWIPVAGAVCADGSMTGMGVNPHQGSTTLTVYFEGGGACWNDETCQGFVGNGGTPLASNLNGYNNTEFADGGTVSSYGIFQRSSNPLANENFVYIPYCTGDIHAGSNDATYNNLNDAGTFVIHHQGFTNAGLDLDVIKATFPSLSRLVVTGSSAGGYGSFFNYERFHQAYPGVQSYLIDDSGPPLPIGAEYSAQDAKWHHFANLPADCPACTPADGGAFYNVYPYLTAQDPNFRGSLLETDHDEVISAFFESPTSGVYGPLVQGQEDNLGCVGLSGTTPVVGPGPCDFTADLQTVYTKLAAANVTGGGQLRAHIEHDVFHTYLGGAATYAKVAPFIASQLGLDGGVDGGWVDDVPTPF
jgi:hypothetical protein